MEKLYIKDGFVLEEADPREFSVYHSIYRLGRANIWFPLSIERSCIVFEGLKNVYWIKKNEAKIGGISIKPNEFGPMFLIPPYENEWEVVKAVVSYVDAISDASLPVIAHSVEPKKCVFYQRLGFQIVDTEKCMIRPTEGFEVNWTEEVYTFAPSEENISEISNLFYEVFRESTIPSLANKDIDSYTELLENFFKNEQNKYISDKCSSVIFDGNSHDLIGACIVGLWEELPQINDIAVIKSHRRRGLATRMIKHALNNSRDDYPFLRLWVKSGNSAESLYYNLGFLPGVENSILIKSPN